MNFRSRMRVSSGCLAAVVVYGLACAVSAPVAAADTIFTWQDSGTGNVWSIAQNWVGDSAPPVESDVGTLVFPFLVPPPQNNGFETSMNNEIGVVANQLSIDDGTPYVIGGDGVVGPLTIGSGGIVATTSASEFAPAELDLPIALSAAQTWTIDGGPQSAGELISIGGVTGTAQALTVDLSRQGFLALSVLSGSLVPTDNEVGNVTIVGASSVNTGLNAFLNGTLDLADATLNSSDGNTLQLTNAQILGEGVIGSVNSTGGLITAGNPLGTLAVNGTVKLDPTSALQFAIADSGGTAGTDYSQLATVGAINLNTANLDITGADANNTCPSLAGGTVETLITTTGTIAGTFANLPNGATTTLDCNGSNDPRVEINYTSHAVTATVLPIPTTTTLSTSQSSSKESQAVTLTATVTATSATVAGTVAFEDDGAPVTDCSAVPVTASASLARATCEMSFGSAGAHSLQAVFTPVIPAVLAGSSSSPAPFDVSPSPTPPVPPSPTLSVSLTGSGSVRSATAQSPIASCPGACSGIATGTGLTLTATPATGWQFAGWGGACSGTGPCILPLTASESVTATFSAVPQAVVARPLAPTISKLRINTTTATVVFKKPQVASSLQCALVRHPTGRWVRKREPAYAPCGIVTTFRHLSQGIYTLYARSITSTGDSTPITRQLTIR